MKPLCQAAGYDYRHPEEARRKKDWTTADAIRDRLDAIGYVIEDSPQGARWKKREI